MSPKTFPRRNGHYIVGTTTKVPATGRIPKFENIARLKFKHTDASDGWQVMFTKNLERHSFFFCDSKYGGKRQALLHAVEYRDALRVILAAYAHRPKTERPRKE